MPEEGILDKIKLFLGIKGQEEDAVLGVVLESVEEAILNYCNLQELPEGLYYTVVRMAIDVYRNECPGEKEIFQGVSSVSVGDTKTSFASAGDAGYLSGVLKEYKRQLNRYRKVGF